MNNYTPFWKLYTYHNVISNNYYLFYHAIFLKPSFRMNNSFKKILIGQTFLISSKCGYFSHQDILLYVLYYNIHWNAYLNDHLRAFRYSTAWKLWRQMYHKIWAYYLVIIHRNTRFWFVLGVIVLWNNNINRLK